uniref:C2H2-type domain-containing protein n=1 Tax=Anopheles coluzzii TaxID=1518534 RepID=A0A8W7P574_ANOCL
MASVTRCEVCFSTADSDRKAIFAEENSHIVGIVAKHLGFEITPTVDDASICSKCWSALQEFHKYYCEIEAVRQQHEHEPLAIGDKQQGEVTVVCDSLEPSYRTEFFEVKVEPFEQTDVFEQENSNGSDEKPLHCAFVKCEEPPIDLDPTAPSSDEDSAVPQGSRSDSSSPDRRKPKRERNPKRPPTSDTETKQSKVAAQKEEDESLHNFYKRIVCEVCDIQRMLVGEPQIDFGTWRALLRHTKEVHKHDKVYVKCPVCEMKMRTKQTLLQHMDWHENPEKYRCEHMEEHDESLRNSTSVPCTICGQVMRDKYILTRHIKLMHTVQPAVSCETCGKTFKCKRNLSVHMTNVCLEPTRLYPCTICGKEFRRKNKLKEHMSTHTGKPLYMCSFCPETFRQDTHLYHHRKNAHYERWLEMQQQRKEGVRFKLNELP